MTNMDGVLVEQSANPRRLTKVPSADWNNFTRYDAFSLPGNLLLTLPRQFGGR
jgi:hypothetical protein